MCWKVKEACTVLEGEGGMYCAGRWEEECAVCAGRVLPHKQLQLEDLQYITRASYPHMKVFLQICKFPLHEGSNLLNVEVPQPCVQVILAGETDLALASLFIVQVPQRLFYLIRKRLRRENSQT